MMPSNRFLLPLCFTAAVALFLEQGMTTTTAFSYTQMQSRVARGERKTIRAPSVSFFPSSSSSLVIVHSATVDSDNNGMLMIKDDEEAMVIWNRAKEYASEEICDDYHKEYVNLQSSLQEGRTLLKQSIRIQSGCVAGTLTLNDSTTTTNDNDEEAAAQVIITQLRNKIQRLESLENHAKNPSSSPPSQSAVPMIATELALGAMIVVVVIFWTTLEISNLQGEDHIPPAHIYDWWSSFVHHFL